MSTTNYSEYQIDAPQETAEELREQFHEVTGNGTDDADEGSLVLIAPSGEDAGILPDSPPTNPVKEFLNENNLDYEVLFSSPIRKPSDLPDSLRDTKSVTDIFGDIAIAPYIEDAIGDTDPREHMLQGRLKFGIGSDYNNESHPDPITPETIESLQEDDLIDEKPAPYPSGQSVLDWNEDLQDEFNNVEVRGIGEFMSPMPGWEDGVVMLDGVGITTLDDSPLSTEVVDWVRDRFEQTYDESSDCFTVANPDYLSMTYPTEFGLWQDDHWLRMWWD